MEKLCVPARIETLSQSIAGVLAGLQQCIASACAPLEQAVDAYRQRARVYFAEAGLRYKPHKGAMKQAVKLAAAYGIPRHEALAARNADELLGFIDVARRQLLQNLLWFMHKTFGLPSEEAETDEEKPAEERVFDQEPELQPPEFEPLTSSISSLAPPLCLN
jgi:hypothetical protein